MKDKYPIINSVDNLQQGYVVYPLCIKCGEPDKVNHICGVDGNKMAEQVG